MRIFIIYRPARFFGDHRPCAVWCGVLIGLRFLVYYATGGGSGHIQSLNCSASVLLTVGFQTLLVALLADLIAANRQLLEDVRFRQKSGEALIR